MGSLSDSDLDLTDDNYLGSGLDNDLMYDGPEILPRCGLCRFSFHPGDDVMVCHPQCPVYSPSWVGKYFTPYYEDPDEEEFERGYHLDCIEVASPDLMINGSLDPNIFDATGYGANVTEPLPSFEARRVRWLRQSLALDLNRTLFDRLPLEICEDIASYCLCERALQVVRDLWMQPSHSIPKNTKVRIVEKKSYWVQYVEIEGLQYVKSLSGRRQSEHDVELFAINASACLNIYIAEDDLGIRKIIISGKDEFPAAIRSYSGVRWVVHRHQNAPFWFRMRFDGIKLRRLAITHTADSNIDFFQRRWTTLPERFDLFPKLPPAGSGPVAEWEAENYAIDAVDWNSPGVYGYSFNLMEDSAQIMIAHQSGEPLSSHMDAYAKGRGRGSWVYMPIDPEERISELWARKQLAHRHNGSGENETLILRTNKGRSLVLGTHLRKMRPKYRAVAALPSTKPFRVFYTRVAYMQSWLGFEQVSTWDTREIQLPSPWESDTTFRYFYSSVNLDGLAAVTPCWSWKEERESVIIGLLFTYTDGRQRCAGQVRLDRLEARMPVSSETMWLGCSNMFRFFSEMGVWPPYGKNIDWIGFSEPMQDGKREYLEVPLRGRLDWYFCGDECSVSHHESGEPQDEMREVMAQEAACGKACSDTVVKTFSMLIGGMDL